MWARLRPAPRGRSGRIYARPLLDCKQWIFRGAPHASSLGLHRHSRESGNPEVGQPDRHNKTMKMQHAPFNGFNNMQRFSEEPPMTMHRLNKSMKIVDSANHVATSPEL